MSLKKTGSTSVVVTAKPGDHIIFDEDGYAVFVMEAGSFKKKCTEKKKELHQPSRKPSSKAATATKMKAAPKKKPVKKKRTYAKPSPYMTAINAFNKEVESIRKAYKKPETDQAKLREDIAALALKSDQKNYTDYLERRIKRLKDQKIRATDAEIVRIGIALRPLVQTLRGTLRDAKTDNRKVLEPSLDNLIRWSKSPGQYDLAGVDASGEKTPTVKANVKAKERQGFVEWLFSA